MQLQLPYADDKNSLNFFPVDGKWTDWSKYNECSVKCGGGMKKRTRGCSNPAPQHGGLECKGDAVESKSCNTHKCPGWSLITEILNGVISYELDVPNFLG